MKHIKHSVVGKIAAMLGLTSFAENRRRQEEEELSSVHKLLADSVVNEAYSRFKPRTSYSYPYPVKRSDTSPLLERLRREGDWPTVRRTPRKALRRTGVYLERRNRQGRRWTGYRFDRSEVFPFRVQLG